MNPHRLIWIDLLRFLAIFMLICCHSADGFNFFPEESPDISSYQLWGAIWGSLMRPCVPLFVMITGALLLPTEDNLRTICTKRISRVLWPFLLWSCIYTLFPWLLGVFGYKPESILIFFPYSGEEGTCQDLLSALRYLIRIPINFNVIPVHMWYIYMLIGLYLYLPVFSAWIKNSSEHDKLVFIGIWAVTLFIPYIHHFLSATLWGECDWNSFGMLYYFAGFNGYLLLGHYLKNHSLKFSSSLPLALVMFTVGYIITFSGFRWISSNPHIGSDLELFWFYCSPQVVLMTSAIFILFVSLGDFLNRYESRLLSWGSCLTKCGFGIYMIHYMMTGPAVYIMRHIGVPIPLQIPFAAAIVFIVSWSLTALLYRIIGKKTRYILG